MPQSCHDPFTSLAEVMPTSAPNTTSLVQCLLSYTRDQAVPVARV